ncbi:hypothetical protein SEVIR_5G397501v4 [Setaria viridis]|uniref:Uncharacterized protein n=2 Tax=Setaria viridis TaxID=4556 RepID=A0A4U6UUQ3_SETVI|nr:hypothetical protein SEVIR_5G397501v2 [Setaria viridis]
MYLFNELVLAPGRHFIQAKVYCSNAVAVLFHFLLLKPLAPSRGHSCSLITLLQLFPNSFAQLCYFSWPARPLALQRTACCCIAGCRRQPVPHRRPRAPHMAHLPAPDDPGRRRLVHPGAALQPHRCAVEVSNPNRRVSVYYDRIQAAGLYQGERFGRAEVPVSFQGTRRTDAVPAVRVGSSPVDLNVSEFGEDNGTRVFPVDLWVDGVVRYKFGELAAAASTLAVNCRLALKLMVVSGWVDCTVIDVSDGLGG